MKTFRNIVEASNKIIKITKEEFTKGIYKSMHKGKILSEETKKEIIRNK